MSNTAPQLPPDPLLDEIRAIKQSVSARFDHDVTKLCEHLRTEQERSGHRVVRREPASRSPSRRPGKQSQ